MQYNENNHTIINILQPAACHVTHYLPAVSSFSVMVLVDEHSEADAEESPPGRPSSVQELSNPLK